MAIQNPQTWPGSSSFSPGDTPFGIYDSDAQFQLDVDSFANWGARRLGYPVMEVELQDIHFYAAYEEAISEYGAQLNMFNARDNMLNVLGNATGSNMTQKYQPTNMNGVIKIAKEYGTEAGSGGNLTWFSGSIALKDGIQVYDFTDTNAVTLETGSFDNDQFTIRKVFHEANPAISRYLDPSIGSLGTYQQLLGEFGWTSMGSPINFMMMPMHHDLMRLQSIEFYRQIRRSAYSFSISKNRIRIFPIPRSSMTLWFHYTLNDENADNADADSRISDISNIPYSEVRYSSLNSMARQWIRQYALAIVKENLGQIRAKYSTIPIPNSEITVDGAALVDEGKNEKESLIEDLKEKLDSLSRQKQLERKQGESEAITNHLKHIPSKIYIF